MGPLGGKLERDFWTVLDVAERLGVTPATIRSYRYRGVLPEPRYIGRTPVWERDVIEAWIMKRPGQGAGGGRKRTDGRQN
ncbi:helix-turn-helix transcriptional regulator [Nonomuraea sp. NPDC003560]|uniref:helix-turn-helix transcriptional regulator n=1 Tax=Nonomuraea sp. NPDC003560 TaxID=3364341 RepID=UPI0036CF60D3